MGIEQDLANTKNKVEEVVNRITEVQTKASDELKTNFDQAMAKVDQTFARADAAIKAQGDLFKAEILDIRTKATTAFNTLQADMRALTETVGKANEEAKAN